MRADLGVLDDPHRSVTSRMLACGINKALCQIPAMRAGVARQKQTQTLGHTRGLGFNAGQAGAVRAQSDAFALCLGKAVGVVIDFSFSSPPVALALPLKGLERRRMKLPENIVA